MVFFGFDMRVFCGAVEGGEGFGLVWSWGLGWVFLSGGWRGGTEWKGGLVDWDGWKGRGRGGKGLEGWILTLFRWCGHPTFQLFRKSKRACQSW